VKALYYNGSDGVEWRDHPAPTIEDLSDALVRPIAVSTCDLDQAIINGLGAGVGAALCARPRGGGGK